MQLVYTHRAWKSRENLGDPRDNAAIILEFSNVCPFKFHGNSFVCAYCPYNSPDFGPIKTHTKQHNDIARLRSNMKTNSVCKVEMTHLKCEICQEAIKDISTLFEHLIEAHGKPLKRNVSTGVLPYLLGDGFECADCGVKFDLFRHLNSHINKHYPNYICSECGFVFTNEERMKAHLLVHQKNTKTFKCTKCDGSFPTIGSKRRHMSSMHNMFAYKCPYCEETFKEHHLRVGHLNKLHNKNISYPCSLCSRVFTTSSNRSTHLRRYHMKKKRYMCSLCGDLYTTVFELKHHLIKHGGEKKYQCEVCNKSYARKKTLTEHMRIHNDDKRFVCVHCGKAFVQKCTLKKHLKTHESVDVEDVEFCDQVAYDARLTPVTADASVLETIPKKINLLENIIIVIQHQETPP